IDVMRSEKCQHCNGTGAKPGTKAETCPTCKGQGQVRQAQQTLFGQFMSITTCPDCKGKGKIIRDKCDECHGRGMVHRKHTIEVKIPAGIERGMRLRIPHAGGDGINDGPSGDLYLMIDVEKHPDFERDGPDLHTNLILTYPQAVLGTTAKINTLDGSVTEINIPAGTYQGQVFKVKGKGMPKINSLNAKGDLYAHVYIEIPKQLTEKQRELIKALADEMKTPVNGEQGFFDKVKNLFS
ncbi:MAG: molecular chaperone DnaJ, partial [Synergistaceae bacterium]|nr:molecular chaperone DnaJ [Synergistaceae bacterium]